MHSFVPLVFGRSCHFFFIFFVVWYMLKCALLLPLLTQTKAHKLRTIFIFLYVHVYLFILFSHFPIVFVSVWLSKCLYFGSTYSYFWLSVLNYITEVIVASASNFGVCSLIIIHKTRFELRGHMELFIMLEF